MARHFSSQLIVTSALVCGSALPLVGRGQGTITYFQPSQPIPVVYNPFLFPPVYYDLDVDGNGSADYRFNLRDGLGVSVEPIGSNRQIALPAIPPDLGSDLDPLPLGFQIGSSLAPDYYWVDLNSPGLAGHSLISSSADFDGNVVFSGLFHGQNAYMGIEFLIGGQPHYGWIHINNPAGTVGGYILEWAYETQAGVPILGGAVPEPSACALLSLGGGLLFWRLRRK